MTLTAPSPAAEVPPPRPARGGGERLRDPAALASTAGASGTGAAVTGLRRRVDGALDRLGLGHLAHRVWQFVRYGAVSLIATLTSLTVLGALVATATLTPGWANIVATGVGTVPSFELNRRWVWGKTGRRSLAAEVVPFCVLSFAGLALSTLLVSTVGQWAAGAGLDTFWRTAAVEVANLAAFGSLWILQFLVLDRVLFARRSPSPTPTPATPSSRRSAVSGLSPRRGQGTSVGVDRAVALDVGSDIGEGVANDACHHPRLAVPASAGVAA
jgi:putative flippase GtrA